jgi:hypothetical protein
VFLRSIDSLLEVRLPVRWEVGRSIPARSYIHPFIRVPFSLLLAGTALAFFEARGPGAWIL